MLSNNDILKYRIVPKNAEDGLWINPITLHPENDFIEPSVTKIQFRCTNTKLMQQEIIIKWEQIKVNNNHELPFKKNITPTDSITLSILNRFETEIPSWKINEHQLFNDDYVSPSHSYTVKGNSFSPTLNINLDSSIYLNNNHLLIKASLWARSFKSYDNKKLVISIENHAEVIYWEAANFKDFIIDSSTWNYITINRKISIEKNSEKHAVLKIYVWNNDGNEIRIDDFRVQIISQSS